MTLPANTSASLALPLPARVHTTALVLFSGGQDSTTCLAQALSKYERVETIAFDYGQRHKVELEARLNVLRELKNKFPQWAGRLGQDHLLDLAVLGQVSDCSLTRDVAFKMESSGLPNTFVPGRNLLFLTLAAALAYRRGLQVLVTGVCETDFSGYPDCRDDTMKAMQLALSLGMDKRFLIETPLMWIDKADTWRLAHSLGEHSGVSGGGAALVALIVEHTHTCYLGDRLHRHDWGYGCGACPACELRARGFRDYQAGLSKP
ncbi:MAG: queC [Polaromonas sp.]|nr:queC [Polaromonas sp.]